ncbi:MAG: hypothetical protein IKK47_04635 [Ruminococcus sp.]|nr:hypothetical protein [Ruminococcus sp.]
MSKVRDFFTSLNKSTKITLISCGCFVALTVVILCFFVLFPISPNDTIQNKYGREAKATNNNGSAQTITTQPSSDSEYIGSRGTAVSTTTVSTNTRRTRKFSVTVTTGEGFFSGGRIPTGSYETITTTEPVEEPTENTSEIPTEDPSVNPTEPMTGTGIEDPTEPITGSGTEDPTEPPLVEDPTDPPVEVPTDPPTTPPPATDPPTSPPPENGDTGNGEEQVW